MDELKSRQQVFSFRPAEQLAAHPEKPSTLGIPSELTC